jgi:lipopolysaccharide biosynthesis protein
MLSPLPTAEAATRFRSAGRSLLHTCSAIANRTRSALLAAYRRIRSAAGRVRRHATGFWLRRSRSPAGVAPNRMLEMIRDNHRRDYEYMPLAAPAPISAAVRCIAFYLPQFHPTPENSAWWGPGFTDWVNVGKALPEFVGHCQPHIPGELGYYDLRLKEVQRRQAELARQHGLHGFCYYYYWFNGVRLLDAPLRTMLEDAHNDFPFCLCWANENWTRRWDGLDHEVLVAQSHSPGDDLAFIAGLAPCLRDRRYIRIDGRPLIVVYRPSLLPDARATAERWRTYCRDHGIGEIFLATTQAFERTNPASIGFDAAIEFAPNNIPQRDVRHEVELLDQAFAGQVFDYRALIERSFRHAPPRYPLFRSVCPGWDNTARRPGRGTVFAHASPAGYQEWLERVCAYTLQYFQGDARLVFINAWNEWAEGAYLEPDRRTGYALLNATAKALRNAGQSRPSRPARVAVIAHVYYEELWPEISSRLRAWDVPFALHVTTPHNGFADVVRADWPDAIVARVPNRGRDLAAFLQQAAIAIDGGAELLCKVHTKRSTHRADGEQWRKDIYRKILGDRHAVRSIIQAFTENAAVGIVAPEGHVVAGEYYWGSNANRVRSLAARIGYPGDPTPFLFAAGSMFWARSEALQPILNLGLETADFEEEDAQLDGTLAHALERLFPIAAKLGGYRLVDTRIVGKPTGRANLLRSQRELAVLGDVGGEYAHAQSCRSTLPTR